jgi:hypothetical protein
LSHDTAKSFSPVAGTKWLTAFSETLDEELFGRHDVYAV